METEKVRFVRTVLDNIGELPTFIFFVLILVYIIL